MDQQTLISCINEARPNRGSIKRKCSMITSNLSLALKDKNIQHTVKHGMKITDGTTTVTDHSYIKLNNTDKPIILDPTIDQYSTEYDTPLTFESHKFIITPSDEEWKRYVEEP